jgi:putative hydrolase of HD superfamily
MPAFEENILELFETIHPLDRIARAGYVLRGVPHPENVAAHSHFVALLTLLVCDACPGEFDRERALAIALTHDLCESQMMDIPMPMADAHLRAMKDEAEQAITEKLLDGFDPKYAAYHQDFLDAGSKEARLVRGLDKVQMMLKIIAYQKEGVGRLAEFWNNPKNFNDFGLEPVSRLFEALCTAAGKTRPR